MVALTAQQKRCVELCLRHRLTNAGVAARLGISEHTVDRDRAEVLITLARLLIEATERSAPADRLASSMPMTARSTKSGYGR